MSVSCLPDDRPFLVLIGLMGAGKSAIGSRLARRLGVPFVDADDEIARAAGCSIPEIFDRYGEAAFRDGERKVIARLLNGPPGVLATGGGAYMDADTRTRIAERGVAVWLRADLDTLVERTGRRGDRPLLRRGDSRQVLAGLIDERYPVYGQADIIIDSCHEPLETTVDRVIDALNVWTLTARRPEATC